MKGWIRVQSLTIRAGIDPDPNLALRFLGNPIAQVNSTRGDDILLMGCDRFVRILIVFADFTGLLYVYQYFVKRRAPDNRTISVVRLVKALVARQGLNTVDDTSVYTS